MARAISKVFELVGEPSSDISREPLAPDTGRRRNPCLTYPAISSAIREHSRLPPVMPL